MMQVGPYEVQEEIARGGMGVVYRARDPRLDRDVALKVLLRSDPTQTRRLVREAESLARLRHPHIVGVHSVEEHAGRPVLVMEWVAGESLQGRIDRAGPLEPDEAVALVRSLAEALAYAHGQGVLHRDLKPGNVLLDAGEERPRLTDFGIARLLDEDARLSKTGQLLGSPDYWAPEQASGLRDQVGPWTDVYGLGATLYAALTGGPPFEVSSLIEAAAAAAGQEPDPPSTRAPDVDAELDAICLRCLAKDPAARYESVADLADALEGYLAGERYGSAGRAVVALWAAGILVFLVGVWLVAREMRASRDPVQKKTEAQAVADAAPVASTPSPEPAKPGAESWIARARARLARRAYHAATAAVEEVLKIEPDSAVALGLRGRIHIEQGKQRAALRDIERAIRLAPRSAEAWWLKGMAHYRFREYRQALAPLDQALRLDPSLSEARVDRAGVYRMLGQLDHAEADFRELTRRQPRVTDHWLNLASMHVQRKRPREALRCFDRALALDPAHHDALWGRGMAYATLGKREPAVRDLARAIARKPNHYPSRISRAQLRLMQRDDRGAVEDTTVCLRLRPQDIQALAIRCTALSRLRRFDAAERDITILLQREPNHYTALNMGTINRLHRKRWKEALAWANRMVRAHPSYVESYRLRARALLELKLWARCARDCEMVISSQDTRDHAQAYAWRFSCYMRLNREVEAISDLRAVVRLAPRGSALREWATKNLASITEKKKKN